MMSRSMFFSQAEDGIRDAHYGLEFRRVLFRPLRPAIRIASGQCAAIHGHELLGAAVDHLCAGPVHDHDQAKNAAGLLSGRVARSEEHTYELQSLMRISYAVFCLLKQ